MTDDVLLTAMRDGDAVAWGTYEMRFKPIVEAYARRAKIPTWDWAICVTEVLEDEGLRLSSGEATHPVNLAAYLIAAVRHRYLRLKRAELCRERNYDAAAENRLGEWVISTVCSEEALRTSHGVDDDAKNSSGALTRLAAELCAGLTPDEEAILVWVSERVPHSQIAKWLGTSYDGCTKRIWRLCRRLRSEASARRATYSFAEQNEIDRFMRRAMDRGQPREQLRTPRRLDELGDAESYGRGSERRRRSTSRAG